MKNYLERVPVRFGGLFTGLVIFHAGIAVSPAVSIIIPLTNDSGMTSTPSFGTSKAGPLDDPFAYDPDNPDSPAPQQDYTVNPADLWHSTDGSGNTSYAVLFDAAYSDLHIDFYARTDDPGAYDRDDNLVVLLYNGDWTTPVETIFGVNIDNVVGANAIDPMPTTVADRFRINNTSATNWSIAELRATTVPEPSALLISAMGLGLVSRRRR